MGLRPRGPLFVMGGGIAIVLGTLMDWGPRTWGLDRDFNGLFGPFALVVGLGLAALGAAVSFAPTVRLPRRIGALSMGQVAFVAALCVFLWSFALFGEDFVKAGVHMTWIGGAAAAAGAATHVRVAGF